MENVSSWTSPFPDFDSLRGSTFLVLLPPSAYVGEHTPVLILNFLVNLGNLMRVAGKEPLKLGKLPRYAPGIASPVDAMPHERQGLLAAHGAALEETLVVSRRPPRAEVRQGVRGLSGV